MNNSTLEWLKVFLCCPINLHQEETWLQPNYSPPQSVTNPSWDGLTSQWQQLTNFGSPDFSRLTRCKFIKIQVGIQSHNQYQLFSGTHCNRALQCAWLTDMTYQPEAKSYSGGSGQMTLILIIEKQMYDVCSFCAKSEGSKLSVNIPMLKSIFCPFCLCYT